MPNLEAPRAYPEGSNFPIPMAPVSPDSGDLSHNLVKNRSLPAWRRGLIAVTAVASGLTAAGGTSPALAGGNRMLVTASAEGTAECVTDPNLMTVNRKFADEIASGKVVIAAGPPIAALEDGAETAEVITGISVEEALQNLIIPVEACAPKEKLQSPNEFVDSMIDQVLGEQGTIGKTSYADVEEKVLAVWNTHKDLLINMEIPDYGGDKFTEEFIHGYLKLLLKGRPQPGENKEHIKSQRMGFSAGFSVMAISAANKTEDPQLKKDLYDMANISYYYGIWLNAFGNLERSKKYVDDIIIASSQAILNYTPSVDQK